MNRLRLLRNNRNVLCAVWIAICFAMTSAVYLSWVYHLMAWTGDGATEWLTMVAGYYFQAAGLGLFIRMRRRARGNMLLAFRAAVVIFLAVSLPAISGTSLAGTLIFGFLMNTLCGVIAGFYLNALAVLTDASRQGGVFGGGYGLSTAAVWALSLIGGGSFMRSSSVWFAYAALGCLALLLAWKLPLPEASPDAEGKAPEENAPRLLPFLCVTVLLLSLVKNLGFSFPSADLAAGVHLELSRVFYAAGLIAAGLLSDKNRRYGAVCTLAALAMPFLLLALTGERVPAFICWSLGYFFFGFFSVFRVLLFLDLAAQKQKWHLAPLGLLVGRLGDALGTGICLLLGESRIALTVITALLFMLTLALFFHLYQQMYQPEAIRQKSEQEVFETFSLHHDLSAREREVLRQVIAERSNAEIAEALFVSESTVKYHVHNLLRKTGCKTRMELIEKYAVALYPQMRK